MQHLAALLLSVANPADLRDLYIIAVLFVHLAALLLSVANPADLWDLYIMAVLSLAVNNLPSNIY